MMVAGLGCRKGVSEAEVLAAIKVALKVHDLDLAALDALAVPEAKTDEPSIHTVARSLGLVVIVIGENELRGAGKRTLSHSIHSLAATGVSSASEAAALAAIGVNGHLLGPRLATGPVTCALAADENLP